MNRKVEALQKLLVAMVEGAQASDFTATSVAGTFKELAVKVGVVSSVDEVPVNSIASIMNFISDNIADNEENEPFDLTVTKTHATVTVKRGGKTIAAGRDILYNGDKITITATADEGYALETLTVNGTAFTSGKTFTVNGHNVAIVASAAETQE